MDRFKIPEIAKYNETHHRLMPDVILIKDPLLTVVNGYVTIDILALGKELWRLYPEEWRNKSIKEIVESHYGKEAVEFLEVLI